MEMGISLNIYQTTGFAIIILLIGRFLRKKISFFQKFAIPAPVIGGLIFAIINTTLRMTGTLNIEFDSTLQEFFMVLFFTSIGFNASIMVLKKGGKKVLIFLFVAVLLCILQNAVAVGLSGVVGMDPKLALMTGSTPMTGGHGTAAAMAKEVEGAGIQGAEAMAIAAATFGLIAGSLMGGPVGNRLITKNDLLTQKLKEQRGDPDIDESLIKEEKLPLDGNRIAMALFILLIAIGVGTYLTQFLNYLLKLIMPLGKFPIYIGPIIIGIILRNISEGKSNFVPIEEVQVIGDASLNVFLAMALMSVRLWELAAVAGPMIILLLGQAVLMVLFAMFVTFNLMGRNYDAAVMAAGHCGFGLGATPNGVANMDSVCDKFVYSKLAFFVIPIVGGMFIDLFNVFIITFFLNLV